jgi:hypothetical protein
MSPNWGMRRPPCNERAAGKHTRAPSKPTPCVNISGSARPHQRRESGGWEGSESLGRAEISDGPPLLCGGGPTTTAAPMDVLSSLGLN